MNLRPHVSDAMRLDWARRTVPSAPESLDRQLASAQIAADEGRVQAGRRTLRLSIGSLDLAKLPRGLWLPVCVAALHCEDYALIGELLTAANLGAMRIDVQLQQDGPPCNQNTFHVRISAPADIRFEMPIAAYVSPHMPFLVSRWIATVPVFARYVLDGAIDDGVLALNVGDFGRVPGLAFCTNSDEHVLMPDPEFLQSEGYQLVRRRFAERPVPWQARRQVALWRGATTGRASDPARGWRSLPRIRLCETARSSQPDLFDVGISRLELLPNHPAREELPRSGLMRPPMPVTDFQSYRYQIDIDGHTSAWGGLFQKLLTGSPVLKVESELGWRQWYYDRLQPWENYVPISADMSDLAAKVRWLASHDTAAERIGKAGRALADTLTYQSEVAMGAAVIRAGVERFAV